MLLDTPLGNDVVLTYGTPILQRRWPDTAALNTGLRQLILAKERAHPEFGQQGIKSSSAGGWQSDPDVLNWPGAEIARLRELIFEGFSTLARLALGPTPERMRVRMEPEYTAWANINRDGNYNVLHSHPGNHWSGVYYIDAGEPDPAHPLSGAFEFHDPRGGATALPVPGFDFGHKQVIQPQAGMMLMFPSWHQHMVHPFRGRGERIVVAFNIHLRRFQVFEA